MLHASILFHLNLCYSSLEREARGDVVRRCYWPLLELLEQVPGLRIAVEAPAHTLEIVDQLDPDWSRELTRLVRDGRIEFVGSGDSQLIGPLVPERVHQANQRLGAESYEQRFGRAPSVALVNEMAFSQGIVDGYLDAGYETLVCEWNNARQANPDWPDEARFQPARTRSPRGLPIDVLWVDTIAFQKLQRAVHSQLDADEYTSWIAEQDVGTFRHMFLYAGDAEIFDHRPGRFATEPDLKSGEWVRMAELLGRASELGVRWTTPSGALEAAREDSEAGKFTERTLSTAAVPIPVKKQPKYNVARWAVSGRADLRANAACHGEAFSLASEVAPLDRWRGLCRRWASDARTHLTDERWKAPARGLDRRRSDRSLPELPARPHTTSAWRREGRRIVVETDGVAASFLLERGLAIESVTFTEHDSKPWFGTLPMGTFEDIDWTADFYSGHLVVDMPGEPRVTDLSSGALEVQQCPEGVCLTMRIVTALGPLTKRLFVGADSVRVAWDLPALGKRPNGSLRLGAMTLLDERFGERLFVTTANGGARERYPLEGDIDQSRPISPVVSSRGGFGAVNGRLVIDDGERGLELIWDPTRAPVMPLLQHVAVGAKRFCRVSLSLAELDDTHRDGGSLPAFELVVRGFARLRAGAPA